MKFNKKFSKFIQNVNFLALIRTSFEAWIRTQFSACFSASNLVKQVEFRSLFQIVRLMAYNLHDNLSTNNEDKDWRHHS